MKVKRKWICWGWLLLFFSFSAPGYGQKAELIKTTLLDGPDGMTIDKDGAIYIANWGKNGKGSSVIKISADGTESVFADSLTAPDGLTFDSKGNLFVSCFGSGEIIKVNPAGKREVYASGLDHPSDLKFDRANNLYVSSFGNFDGNKVYKITPAGDVTEFAKGFTVPVGLSFDKKGTLYVSNFGSGVIHKLKRTSKLDTFASLSDGKPNLIQYLAFDRKGNLYCPSYKENKIYRIDTKGAVTVLKIENSDEALNGPNSVFVFGDTLFFTAFNTNRLYRLHLSFR